MDSPNRPMLLPSGALTLAKESGYRAVRITNLKLPDMLPEGSPSHQSARLVATKMTEAGLRAEVANLVIGPGLDGPRDRSFPFRLLAPAKSVCPPSIGCHLFV